MAIRNTPEKFWSMVQQSDACWIFQGRKNSDGYGKISFGGRKNDSAHRVAWKLKNGDIPSGLCVLHKCDNPPCCNPDHLFLGRNRQNVADRHSKGRSKSLFDSSPIHPAKIRCGEKHWRSKLSASQILQIRQLHAAGLKQSKLGKQFSVNAATISRIVRRVWRSEVL